MPKPKVSTAPPPSSTTTASGGSSASANADGNQNLTVLEWGEGENANKVRAVGKDEAWRDPTEAETTARYASTLQWGGDIAGGVDGKVRSVQLKQDGSGEFEVGEWRDPTLQELAARPVAESPGDAPFSEEPLPRRVVESDAQESSLRFLVDLLKRQNKEILRLTGHLPTPEILAVEQGLDDYTEAQGDPELAGYLAAVREEAARTGKTLSPKSAWDEYHELGFSPAEAIAEEEAASLLGS